MIIKIRTAKYKHNGEPLEIKEFDLDSKGKGIKDDPFIFDSSSDLPQDFEIVESNVYIIIKNCQLNSLLLAYSKNVVIQDCTFRSLSLLNCVNISIIKCNANFMKINQCQSCLLKDSNFDTEFKLYKCYSTTFNNCKWDLFFDSDNLSRGNIIENIKDPYIEDVLYIQKPLLKKKNTFAISSSSFTHGNILQEIECKGSGRINDPIIIDNSAVKKARLKDITLYLNKYYIIFKNLVLKKINLYDSKNVTLENCNISKSIKLKFCSDIKIKSITVRFLRFGACQDIYIENSKIKEINLYKGYKGSVNLKNCNYKIINENALKYVKFN